MAKFDRSKWGFLLSATTCLGAYLALAVQDIRYGTLREQYVSQTIGWYLLAFAGFLLGAWWNERHPIPWRWIWILAIVFRLVMLTTTPTLSDDVYRYIWEGNLVAAGVSPYENAILDPALDAYNIEARELVNNPSLSSPYFPTAQIVFAATAAGLPPHPLSLQLVMVGFELLAAGGLVLLMRLTGTDQRRVLLWLWNPLVIIEIAHGAHLDALMIFLVIASLLATFSERRHHNLAYAAAAPVALALATLTRPVPALLLPVIVWHWTWKQRFLYLATTLVLLVPVGVTSGFGFGGDDTTGLFGSSRAYTETFRFNTAIYQTLEVWMSGRGLDDRGWNEPMALTQLVIGGVFAVVMLAVFVHARHSTTPLGAIRLATVPLGAYAVLTPVLHPWYLLILIALLIFHAPIQGESNQRWFVLAPFAWLSAALILSYLTYRDPGSFAELAWVRRVEWWPTLFLLGAVCAMQRWSVPFGNGKVVARTPAIPRQEP